MLHQKTVQTENVALVNEPLANGERVARKGCVA